MFRIIAAATGTIEGATVSFGSKETSRRPSSTDGWDGLLPGETLTNVVHRTARASKAAGKSRSSVSRRATALTGHPAVTKARVEIIEHSWTRLDAGGERRQTFRGRHAPERRKTAAITGNGKQVAVVSSSAGCP
jgi:hypothetical protein